LPREVAMNQQCAQGMFLGRTFLPLPLNFWETLQL
jgi:hypothetical protein